jgi:carboxyl-terminal processing protease
VVSAKGKKVLRLRKWIFATLAATVCVWIWIYAVRLTSGGSISIEVPPSASADSNGSGEFSVKQLPGEVVDIGVTNRAEPNTGAPEVNKPGRAEFNEWEAVETICGLIEKGNFDAGSQLITTSGGLRPEWTSVSQLKDITGQWQQLQKGREEQKGASYKKEMGKLERLIAGKGSDNNDVNDQNEPNGPVAMLAAVTRTIEFADEQQQKAILSEPCVLAAIDMTKAEAAALEQKGKWFDAYIMYYSWLNALDPNNKIYSDHSDQLIDKAGIAGSFQDSPCETGKQRFDGVRKRIFERAVDALNFNYISKIDYRQMAVKGIKRCRMLAEVVGTLTNKSTSSQEQKSTSEPNASILGESFKDFKPDANAIATLCSALGSLEKEAADWPEGASKERFLLAFDKVLELNLTTAHLPEEMVIAQFAEASFSALDPYTVIVWPKQVQDFEKIMTNEFSGIGIEISRDKGQLTVGSLLPDTPAYNSGLDAGDVIEKVDGMPTKDMTLPCAVKHITGPAGTKVTLTIKHEGPATSPRKAETQPHEITITRAKIVVPTVRGWQRNEAGKWQYMVDEKEKIGYIQLTSFSDKTAPEMEEALNELEKSGMKGLILDLRYNSGGFFGSAVDVTDAFLNEGLIVITRPRFGIPTYEAAHIKGTHPNYPMVVLINAGSASASEIVAGALADPSHRRATLIGERTHGKGVVQGITHYPGEGAQLKYTMAYYHLPSGQRVKSREETEKEGTKDWGIGPDVAVEMRSDELRKMFEVQRDNDVLVKAGHDNAASPLRKHTIEQTVEVDPQLETAILVIKSKLIREQTRTVVKKAA